MFRSNSCGELSISDNGKSVVLIGWAQRIRDHGGKKFIDLRDRFGITQIVFDPEVTENFDGVESIKREFIVRVEGIVRPRPEGTINEKLKTGEIEVLVKSYSIFSKCDLLPFDLDDEHFNSNVNEELRLEYRYLDLRRPEMQRRFIRRHKFIFKMREFLNSHDFLEIETPFLTRSTPEGARDLLVPSRVHKGSFYALPQSPQLFKQLLMVAGFERYFQFARCFRDEDSRKDRQLEFTQLDLEVSFCSFSELRDLAESLLIEAFKVYGVEISKSDFSVLSYEEAVLRFGSDKPDLRIKGLELVDVSDLVKDSGFAVFSKVVKSGGLVKGLKVKGGQDLISRKEIDKLIKFVQENGAKGMAWMKVMSNGKLESSITKFFSEGELMEISKRFNASDGDLLFFIADDFKITNAVLDLLRRRLANDLDLIDRSAHKFVWIVDFPLFQWSEEENRIDAEHSPFTMPNEDGVKFILENINSYEDVMNFKDKLLSLKADCYDIAYNGVEICSGAQRICIPELQRKIFQILNLDEELIEDRFGWFIKAYNYGAPVHRGFALGIDRILMLLEGEKSIREVMAFPKNKSGFCPLSKAPSKVSELQLKELSLSILESNKRRES